MGAKLKAKGPLLNPSEKRGRLSRGIGVAGEEKR